jgi:hypothetical protein
VSSLMATRIVEWYVNATRNDTTVRLPAQSQAEAIAMMDHLVKQGWYHANWEHIPLVPEPEPESKVAKHHGAWPVCERCERKHSPFPHEVEGCPHCMAICQKPTVKPPNEVEPAPEVEAKPKFHHGMTFAEFKDWLEKAL